MWKVAKENPDKIITNKIDFKDEGPNNDEINKLSQYLISILSKKLQRY